MPDKDDPLAEYEAELADIPQPGDFVYLPGRKHNGVAVARLVDDLTPLLTEDLVVALNEGRPAYCQYLGPSGTSISFGLTSIRTMYMIVQLAPEDGRFIAEDDDDSDQD